MVGAASIGLTGWAAGSPQQSFVAIDGSFGAGTEAAGSRFQTAYGMAGDGLCGPTTQGHLNSLEGSDGSTAHFDWSEFTSHDGSGFSGGKVSTAQTEENVRRSMYKLEAYTHSWQHVDSRMQHAYGSQFWWWESGVV